MSHKELPNYINEIKELVFDPCDFKLSNLIPVKRKTPLVGRSTKGVIKSLKNTNHDESV